MPANQSKIRNALNTFNFVALRDELGWSILNESAVLLAVDDRTFILKPIAHKQGLRLLLCENTDANLSIPDLKIRLKLDSEVAKFSQERILVFIDPAQTCQTWMWVKSDNGIRRPRAFTWTRGRTNDDLIQRLAELYVDISEEGRLSITDMAQRTRSAFDVEKVTKQFYKLFEERHDNFMKDIEGILDEESRKWYTSLMLNRLMFLYFIQRKGFLAGDPNYLRTKLNQIKKNYTPGVQGFYDFYNKFLLVLFHDGLSKPSYPSPIKSLIGDVPYLNGGLFDIHQLELENRIIRIPDVAFEKIFIFFDSYQWHLDDRLTNDDNEINPDVLGYIFEKYINRKQMGAYYTKEDITEYISKNTIIPAIFDRAALVNAAMPSFAVDGWIWDILKRNPDAYIYEAVRYGVKHDLPTEIACGLKNVQQRTLWNKPATKEFALPTETWREHIARRQQYQHIELQIKLGRVTSINDLITHNLDIISFARDVIALCDHSPTLRAIYTALESLSVLDPTCGSGAFLFAALNILQPLYEQCLDRMQEMLQKSLDAESSIFFTAVLARMNNRQKHPNKQYFILKTIILQNLYGVDIMEEAVEICKLRLFLKLMAQAESVRQIEPLPDIDFNIRAGNTLVGFARYAEVEELLDSKMDVSNTKERILAQAKMTNTAYHAFRTAQAGDDLSILNIAQSKARLRIALDQLNGSLNDYLAQEYRVNPLKADDFSTWLSTHKPFHWFVEFYSIIEDKGGFDVIIGNPPYVAYPKVRKGYTILKYRTEKANNLYAFAIERSICLVNKDIRLGMIVPIASISTESMKSLQDIYKNFTSWNSNYAVRPGKLFNGVDMNLSITILAKKYTQSIYSTNYIRWNDGINGSRDYIFDKLNYVKVDNIDGLSNNFPKIGNNLEVSIINKMISFSKKLGFFENKSGQKVFYHSGGRYWRKAILNSLSSHYKPISVDRENIDVVLCILNSQLFYWFWIQNSNCMDVVSREVFEFPVFDIFGKNQLFCDISRDLLNIYYSNKKMRERRGDIIRADEINFDVSKAKHIIDSIDYLLSQCYGFTAEELDYIINYDIKYRMGGDSEEE
ncbi:MAG: Eco57I restriction-modification methylase domain-containing protein [Chloroflexi bacterium]|nr:Eco57I restriction-modification methylase domain-containing protein [Chloroflexota bacterium]